MRTYQNVRERQITRAPLVTIESIEADKKGRSQAVKTLRRMAPVLGMFVPSLALILVFSYYPAIRSMIGGFTSWDGFGPAKFVGLQEYRTYFASTEFGPEMRNVALLIVGQVVISISSQLAGAEVISRLRGRAHSVAKYAVALPMVVPIIVQIDIWAYLFSPNGGGH